MKRMMLAVLVLAGCGDVVHDGAFTGDPLITVRGALPPELAAAAIRPPERVVFRFRPEAGAWSAAHLEGDRRRGETVEGGLPDGLDFPLWDPPGDEARGLPRPVPMAPVEILAFGAVVDTATGRVLVASVDDWLLYAAQPAEVVVIDGGPALPLPRGFTRVRRTCVPSPAHLQVVPLDGPVAFTAVPLGERGAIVPEFPGPDALDRVFAKRCGAEVAGRALGRSVFTDGAADVAWSADGGTIYALTGPAPQPVGNWAYPIPVGSGIVAIPLDGGSSRVVALGYFTRGVRALPESNALLVSVVSATGELQPSAALVALGGPAAPSPAQLLYPAPGSALLSPDGKKLAYGRALEIEVWDLTTMHLTTLPVHGQPVAWSPDGAALLIEAMVAFRDGQYAAGQHVTIPVAGGAPTVLPTVPAEAILPGRETRFAYFWNEDGPGALRIERDGTAVVVALARGTTTPVARALAGDGYALPRIVFDRAQRTAYVWSRHCLGLSAVFCRADLVAVPLRGGEPKVVAVAATAGAVAVSPDGRRLALAQTDGVYVVDLP